MKNKMISAVLIGSVGLGGIVGCDDLPGGPREQGAVIGGVAGAAGGAAVAKDNRAIGAVVGGLLGAGGGWLIGQQVDKKNDREDAEKAAEQAQQQPATPQQARQSATADLNKDGFVTLDEVVAMRDAGLDNTEMVRRLEATGQVFELTRSQEDYLINRGVSREVVDRLRTLNQTEAQPAAASTGSDLGSQSIGRDQ